MAGHLPRKRRRRKPAGARRRGRWGTGLQGGHPGGGKRAGAEERDGEDDVSPRDPRGRGWCAADHGQHGDGDDGGGRDGDPRERGGSAGDHGHVDPGQRERGDHGGAESGAGRADGADVDGQRTERGEAPRGRAWDERDVEKLRVPVLPDRRRGLRARRFGARADDRAGSRGEGGGGTGDLRRGRDGGNAEGDRDGGEADSLHDDRDAGGGGVAGHLPRKRRRRKPAGARRRGRWGTGLQGGHPGGGKLAGAEERDGEDDVSPRDPRGRGRCAADHGQHGDGDDGGGRDGDPRERGGPAGDHGHVDPGQRERGDHGGAESGAGRADGADVDGQRTERGEAPRGRAWDERDVEELRVPVLPDRRRGLRARRFGARADDRAGSRGEGGGGTGDLRRGRDGGNAEGDRDGGEADSLHDDRDAGGGSVAGHLPRKRRRRKPAGARRRGRWGTGLQGGHPGGGKLAGAEERDGEDDVSPRDPRGRGRCAADHGQHGDGDDGGGRDGDPRERGGPAGDHGHVDPGQRERGDHGGAESAAGRADGADVDGQRTERGEAPRGRARDERDVEELRVPVLPDRRRGLRARRFGARADDRAGSRGEGGGRDR